MTITATDTDSQIQLTLQIIEAGEGSYSYVKFFPDGECAWIARMVYTCAILYGFEELGHRDRWCYETAADARRALEEWDGQGEPEGWHRHPPTGRRVNKITGERYINH